MLSDAPGEGKHGCFIDCRVAAGATVGAYVRWCRTEGKAGVEMPDALERKYPRAGASWPWFWVFPQATHSTDPRSGVIRRHHMFEFARVGDTGELATVLCPGAPSTAVRWAHLDVEDIVTARRLLKQCEAVDEERVGGVGTVMLGRASAALLGATEILHWAGAHEDIDAVIWTALPPRFADTDGRCPTSVEAASYLLKLRGQERRRAEDYVRRVPKEIRTPNREALEWAMAS